MSDQAIVESIFAGQFVLKNYADAVLQGCKMAREDEQQKHAAAMAEIRKEVGKVKYELREGKDFGRGFDHFGDRVLAILDKHIPKP